jgi:hypothetical protein
MLATIAHGELLSLSPRSKGFFELRQAITVLDNYITRPDWIPILGYIFDINPLFAPFLHEIVHLWLLHATSNSPFSLFFSNLFFQKSHILESCNKES